MKCIENILLPVKIANEQINQAKQMVQDLAEKLQVEHCLNKYPFELSGGEQQRVNLIRSVILKPGLLLCDEPTGNLDSKNSAIVIELLKSLATHSGATLIVVTHNEKIAASFSRKITIEDGQIIS
jgi:ABC-type lipoprotein export system ATPase subunit